jgi:protein O-mannosyl-transferase
MTDVADEPEQAARKRKRWERHGWVGLAVAAGLASAPVLPGTYVLDASSAIAGSTCVTGPLDVGAIFGSDFWCGQGVQSYRPFPVLAWWALWNLGGGHPLPFHVASLVLHVACTIMLARVGCALGFRRIPVLWGAAWFAVMPIHIDAVGSMVGHADLWSSLGLLLAVQATIRRRWTLPLWAALVVFSKETGVIVLPLCWVIARLGPRPSRSLAVDLRLWAVAAVVISMLGVRTAVLGSVIGVAIPHEVNPLVALEWWERIPAAFDLLRRHQQLAVLGTPMSADYSHAAIGVGSQLSWFGSAVGFLIMVVWCTALISVRRDPTRRCSILWLLGSLVLISNLPFLLLAMFAERLFYGPSVPFCLLLGTAVAGRLRSSAARLIGIGYLMAQLVLAMQHSASWTTEDRLTDVTVRHAPGSATAQLWRARQLLRDGMPEVAAEHARAALQIAPNATAAYALLGTALDLQGQPEHALKVFATGFERDPAHRELADLFVQFLLRYEHLEQAAWVHAEHARARDGQATRE